MEPESELVRKHLRSDGMDDDALIRHYIETATEDVENELNYPIIDCALQGFQPDFSGVRLPCVPTYRFNEIEIKYWDAATEQETVLPTENYTVLPTEWICVVFRGTLPALMDRADAVSVTIGAGFAEESLVGSVYKQAILMRVASMYDQRAEWATKYQQASERMIRKIRNNNA